MEQHIQDINHLLGIESPWEISEIKQDKTAFTAKIHVICSKGSVLHCPECGEVCPGYDHRLRKWRHTDICEYRTSVVAKVPRVACFGAWDQDRFGPLGGCADAFYNGF